LRKFILDRECRHIPNGFRLFVYYSVSEIVRRTGLVVAANLTNKSFGQRFNTFSEITFPPYGYVLTRDKNPPNDKMQEITCLGEYSYNKWRDYSFRLPVLPVSSWLPGDYRTKEQIMKDIEGINWH